MIDTTDLTSYIPGYDDYCEPKQEIEYYDDSDVVHDEMMIRREIEKMNRKAIDLNNTNMTFEEVLNLDGYIWENDKLIPAEMIEGE